MVAVLVLADRIFGRSLTRGEHQEFKAALLRDVDRIEKRLDYIEQSRPTTGQLGEAIAGIREQISHMRLLAKNGH